MPDWGLANGPNDTRSHAEMMMQAMIRRDKSPYAPCSCGGSFEAIPRDEERPPIALRTYRCDSCDEHTYDWDHENGHANGKDDDYCW